MHLSLQRLIDYRYKIPYDFIIGVLDHPIHLFLLYS